MTRPAPVRSRPVRLVCANVEDGFEGEYAAHLRALVAAGRPHGRGRGALMLQEVHPGARSTQIYGVGKHIWAPRRVDLSDRNIHGQAAAGTLLVGSSRVRLINFHGPHMGTMRLRYGAQADQVQRDYYAALAGRVERLNQRARLSVAGGDGNQNIRGTARILGGTPHGVGVDGFSVSRGLTVVGEGADDMGRRRGWTDHIAYWVDLIVDAPTRASDPRVADTGTGSA